MKTLRQTCAATVLSLLLAVSALAGQIGSGGIVSPPPPPPDTSATSSLTTIVILTILNLVR